MKKILTLLAMAVLAISATAQDQEKVLFDPEGTYGNGTTLTSENTTLVLGNNHPTKDYDKKLQSAMAYCNSLLGQTVLIENTETGVMEEKTRIVIVTGQNNPLDGAEFDGTGKSTGEKYTPENKNLPQSGTYYTITPKKAGHITAYIVLNAGKNFYVTKSDGTALAVSDLTLKADGEEASEVTLNEDYTTTDKLNGTVEFDVEANETYYVFCNGSKLSLGGYVFTPKGGGSEPSGIFGDLNNDGYVNISDVTVLINIILGLGN